LGLSKDWRSGERDSFLGIGYESSAHCQAYQQGRSGEDRQPEKMRP